ncbi:SPASM domain-containing protein [Paenibacillus albidus]|uniref:radical SAM/SPASM domain-containing protein n=1 Tax=Paenibacillus albidus TaxID=2041023 RepID=UPI001BE6B5DA|nr:radical SAM protein [Paenibacillus albidus]MBT2288072.1 SPASM domain-containing protein [Paenibacillus albidus]
MKPSNYNFFFEFPEENQILAYNSRTASLALMQPSNYDDYLEFANSLEVTALEEEFLKKLRIGGFILDKNIDEIDILSLHLLGNRYNTDVLDLTIATTLNCNLGCVYCFEKEIRNNKKMSDDVKKSIVRLVEQQAGSIKFLNICWYGGEPLLDMNVIRDLSSEFLLICENNQIKYNASIVTNGYKLTPDIASELVEFKVSFAQVTLDGPDYIHDTRRPLIGGQPTFDRILMNIENSCDIIPISLRINTDNSNKADMDSLLELIVNKNLGSKIGVYLAQVKNENDCYNTSTCMATSDFTNTADEFEEKAYKLGIGSNIYQYPKLTGPYCGADCANSYVIDPEGYLYNCWAEIGDISKSFGNLVDYNFEGNTLLKLNYMLYQPQQNENCKECKHLPLCMGGCPFERINNVGDNCTAIKYNLEKKIKNHARFVIENQKELKETVEL